MTSQQDKIGSSVQHSRFLGKTSGEIIFDQWLCLVSLLLSFRLLFQAQSNDLEPAHGSRITQTQAA